MLSGAPGDYVYLVNADQSVSVHKVIAGPSDGTNTVILSGLAAGQVVVTDGMDRLSDGAKIKAGGEKPTAAKAAAPTAQAPGAAAPGAKRSHAAAPGSPAS